MSNSVLQEIQAYVDGCVDGSISVCQYIRFACERHNRDLLRGDIYFDEAAAKRAIDFIELMVHVKGKWAKTKIKLEPWQKFFVGSIFGWKWSESELRRFREANLEVPRKNAKSTLCTCIDLYMLVADGEAGAEVTLAASKEPQAKELFDIALAMIKGNKKFKDYYGITNTTESITVKKTNSSFRFVIGKPADGGNTHCARIEEYHEHKSSAAYDTLKNGMGSREQPLLITASTAGRDIKGAYAEHIKYCRNVVSGIVDDDTLFSLEYTIDPDDDWQDFSVWHKANPNLGVSVFLPFLEAQYKKALSHPSSRSDILTKHLNVWNNESSGWIDLQKWLNCGDSDISLEDFEGEECWMGLDLASRVDLCSLMLVFRREEKYYVFGKHYLNSETANKIENKHFQTWEIEGWLTVTDGAQTDFTAVADDIKMFNDQFLIQELAYDPREATFLMQQIREWAAFECIEVSQGPVNFSEPMKVLEGAYLDGNLVHNNDPVLNWAASNVVLKNSSNKLFYPAKKSNADKIDPIVALIMAMGRSSVAPTAHDTFMFVL